MKQDTVNYGNYWESYYAKIKHNQMVGDSSSSLGYHFGMNWLGKSRYYNAERPCNGYMAELIYYYAPLNDSLYALNEQYLRYKYAPAVNLGADIIVEYGFVDTLITAANHFTSYAWNTGDSSQSITINNSGFYSLSTTDVFGFESIDSIYVRYLADFSLSDTSICYGDTIIMSVALDSSYAFLWSDASTDSLLEITGAGSYWLEITDSLGFSIRDSFVVVVDSFPYYANLGADVSVCEGEEISLLSGTSEAVTYLWNTGETTSSKQIDTSGIYSLIVSDSFGCTAYDTISVTVSGLIPNTGFIADSSCFGLPTNFTDTSNIIAPWNIVSWEWVFNENDTLAVQHPQYNFNNSGNQHVSLKVLTDSGCVGTFSDSVFVIPLPQADFSPEQGCSGQEIAFMDLSASAYGNLNAWKWNFNDPYVLNDSSLIQQAVHRYDSSGSYLCRLIVENEYGCVDTVAKNILIKNTPQADFSFQEACALENIFFSDETQTSSWENILYWNWDLGNGNTSNIPNPYQAYDNAGNYTVSLKVFSINGCSDSVTKIVEVYPLPNAHFFWDNHCAGQNVQFYDSSTVSSGNIISWEWDLSGNLGQSSVQNPLNVYPDSGSYSVNLSLITDKGCTDNASNTVSIFPVPTADFSIDPEYGIPPININFTNNSIGANDYIWDFGDGSIISGISDPTYVYTDTGFYEACLIAINPYFCYDTLCKTVYMIPSYFDVAIDRVIVLDTVNQQIKIEARIVNAGNRKIEQLFLHGQLGSNPPLVEEWNGELMPGEFVDYEFSARFLLSSHLNSDYVCVSAEIPGNYEDDNPNNNKACASITNNFVVGEIYPNPSSSCITIPFNIPESDDLNISIYNTQGQIVAIVINKRTDAGFMNIKFDIKSLSSGIYYLVS
ncbi:MAG: PKD domain-containing protein, partial [Bacteroidales bacterium]|nr:PKD domain-containing protein [Bacteroidales bacterium]